MFRPGSNKLSLHLTKEMKENNQNEWKRRVGYKRRVLVGSVFSQYKRVLGENIFSRKRENIKKEVIAKINLLNRFAIN